MFDSPVVARLFERLERLIAVQPDQEIFEIIVFELTRDKQLETIADHILLRRYEELECWFPEYVC